jgi:protocatechuate 3,4-dioxygenase beta subunit
MSTSNDESQVSPRERPLLAPRRHFLAKTLQWAGLAALPATSLVHGQVATTDDSRESTPNRPACILSPQQTEGPYYLNLNRVRRDITEGKPGIPLSLALQVVDAATCSPIEGAIVDVWHCDAEGEYSGYDSARPLKWGHMQPDSEAVFLRGVQITNREGQVEFSTIYPGCYTSRTTHIHAKVYLNQQVMLTTQFYFPEALTDKIYQQAPYSADRQTRNANDYIMRRAHGDELAMLTMSPLDAGYRGQIVIGVRR